MAFPGEVVKGGLGISKGAAGGIAGGLFAVKSALSAFVRIPEGEMGVRTRFGKVVFDKSGQPKVVGAGPHGVFPFTHSIETIGVQHRDKDLESFDFEREGEKWSAKSSISWKVSEEKEHVYRALYKTQTLPETVTNICSSGLWIVLTSIDRKKLNNQHEVAGGVHELCDDDLLEYGVVLNALRIRGIARSEAQAHADGLARAFGQTGLNGLHLAPVPEPQAAAGA